MGEETTDAVIEKVARALYNEAFLGGGRRWEDLPDDDSEREVQMMYAKAALSALSPGDLLPGGGWVAPKDWQPIETRPEHSEGVMLTDGTTRWFASLEANAKEDIHLCAAMRTVGWSKIATHWYQLPAIRRAAEEGRHG